MKRITRSCVLEKYSNKPTPVLMILKQAEAQARESQIEAALERVRSKNNGNASK